MIVLIIAILIVLSGIINGLKDLSSENWFKINPKYWNKSVSWTNKWEVYTIGNTKTRTPIKQFNNSFWYLWLYPTNYKERFPYSSTLLVPLTDFWHLAVFVQLSLMFASIAIASTLNLDTKILLQTFVVLPALRGLGFFVGYTMLKIIRNKQKQSNLLKK